MAENLAGLWEAAAVALAREDSRFQGLTLSMDTVGETQKVKVEGPDEAVELLLANGAMGPNFRGVLRNIVRGIAEAAGGWEDDLESLTWPMFDLEGPPADEVEEPARETNPPHRPPSVPPLLRVHPGGHEPQTEAFKRIAREIGELVAEKNRAYGNSFNETGEILRVLYPNGIDPGQYDDALAIVRILDKVKRIATDRDALGESPFRDIAGYGILGAERVERTRMKKAKGGS